MPPSSFYCIKKAIKRNLGRRFEAFSDIFGPCAQISSTGFANLMNVKTVGIQ